MREWVTRHAHWHASGRVAQAGGGLGETWRPTRDSHDDRCAAAPDARTPQSMHELAELQRVRSNGSARSLMAHCVAADTAGVADRATNCSGGALRFETRR